MKRRARTTTLICVSAATVVAAVWFAASRLEGEAAIPDPAPLPLAADAAAEAGLLAERRAAFATFRAAKLALPESQPEISLVAVGDLMLSRTVAQRLAANGGPEAAFARVRDYLRAGDITFGNLETALLSGRAIQPGEMVFRSDPAAAASLASAGFDVLSLANNHVPNFGAAGILETLKYLDAAAVAHAGAGADATAARAPAIVERSGLRFAFLAYNDADVVPAGYFAAADHPGTAAMDIENLKADIAAARAAADIVVVSMHSGTEYVPDPNRRQTAFAHAAIDAGADLVIGHHPHVVQTVETYAGKPIIYSLGNFVFDQGWSRETRDGLMAKIVWRGQEIVRIEFQPIVIGDLFRPETAAGVDRERILARLGTRLGQRAAFVYDAANGTFEPDATAVIESVGATAMTGPSRISRIATADINGDGAEESFSLKVGRLVVSGRDGAIWSSPADQWVDDFALADVDGDLNTELALSFWRAGSFGSSKPFWAADDAAVRNHFAVFSLAGGRVRPLWQSSALSRPNCEFVLADADSDGCQELAVLEGEYGATGPECGVVAPALWRWDAWGFTNLTRGVPGGFSGLTVEPRSAGAVFSAARMSFDR
ncbi:MAG: CapA family protein [Patescibacteria group bacterium]